MLRRREHAVYTFRVNDVSGAGVWSKVDKGEGAMVLTDKKTSFRIWRRHYLSELKARSTKQKSIKRNKN